MNWKSILTTAAITGVVTLVTGMLLFWLQSEKAELVYSSITSEPFTEESYNRYIQQVNITNSGKKFVEGINFHIEYSSAIITDHGIKIDPTITYSKEVKSNLLALRIDSLNRGETVKVSLILTTTGKELTAPNISLRAKNVIGDIEGKNKRNKNIAFAISLVSAYMGLFAALIATGRGRFIFSQISALIFRRDYLGAQTHNIASALAISGLPDKAKDLLNSALSRQYWIASDVLAAEAIASNNQEFQSKIIETLKILESTKLIASSSKAIIMCNAARIYENLGKNEQALNILRDAKKVNQGAVKTRLRIDPLLRKFAASLKLNFVTS